MFHWQGSDTSLLPILLTAHQGAVLLRSRKLVLFLNNLQMWSQSTLRLGSNGSTHHIQATLMVNSTVQPLFSRMILPKLLGTWIWGRGSCDDKGSMIAILYVRFCFMLVVLTINNRIAVEALLQHGFKPTRTIVLAFGFDEESAGTEVDLLFSIFGRTWFHLLNSNLLGCWTHRSIP